MLSTHLSLLGGMAKVNDRIARDATKRVSLVDIRGKGEEQSVYLSPLYGTVAVWLIRDSSEGHSYLTCRSAAWQELCT